MGVIELNIGSETPHLLGIATTIASLAQRDHPNLASLVLGSCPAGLLRPAPKAQSRELAALDTLGNRAFRALLWSYQMSSLGNPPIQGAADLVQPEPWSGNCLISKGNLSKHWACGNSSEERQFSQCDASCSYQHSMTF